MTMSNGESRRSDVSRDRELSSRMRVTGCLLGGAIGDALGYPLEFVRSAGDFRSRYGASSPEQLAHDDGPARISDDTQMTLFSAEGLIQGERIWRRSGLWDFPGCVQRAYFRWYCTQGAKTDPDRSVDRSGWLISKTELWEQRAPGNTCLSALESTFRSGTVPTVKSPPNDSKGCGAVMRSAPFGLVAPDRIWAFRHARDAAVLTHGHPSGYLAAAYFAAVIHDLTSGMPLSDAMRAADGLLRNEHGQEELETVLAKVRVLASSGPPSSQAIESLGGGWVGEEALAIALLCATTVEGSSHEAVSTALWRSVAHGGDSDSTGSLTGNLLGTMFGDVCLKRSWLEQLELRHAIAAIAHDLHELGPLGQGCEDAR